MEEKDQTPNPPVPAEEVPQVAPQGGENIEVKEKKSHAGLIVVLGAVILIVVAAIIFVPMLVENSKKGEKTNNTETTANSGEEEEKKEEFTQEGTSGNESFVLERDKEIISFDDGRVIAKLTGTLNKELTNENITVRDYVLDSFAINGSEVVGVGFPFGSGEGYVYDIRMARIGDYYLIIFSNDSQCGDARYYLIKDNEIVENGDRLTPDSTKGTPLFTIDEDLKGYTKNVYTDHGCLEGGEEYVYRLSENGELKLVK